MTVPLTLFGMGAGGKEAPPTSFSLVTLYTLELTPKTF